MGTLAVVATVIGALTGHPALLEWTSGLFVALLPMATGAAILRYRLYDLDRIISRTLAYGLLTVLLGGGYAAVVLGLGQLLGGRQSSLVVAGATLARRVQKRVHAACRWYSWSRPLSRSRRSTRRGLSLMTIGPVGASGDSSPSARWGRWPL